jgi:hypothetical protein
VPMFWYFPISPFQTFQFPFLGLSNSPSMAFPSSFQFFNIPNLALHFPPFGITNFPYSLSPSHRCLLIYMTSFSPCLRHGTEDLLGASPPNPHRTYV